MTSPEKTTATTLRERRAGLLLHLTSLPGPGACGDLGGEAFNFVNFLADCGLSVWQMLPVGPPQGDLSPYQTSSAHAGNPRLIGLDPLVKSGWLDQVPDNLADDRAKLAALRQAYHGFRQVAGGEQRAALDAFIAENIYWLEDYALFRAISEDRHEPWWRWPKGLRLRENRAIKQARGKLADTLDYIRWEQYVFFEQWAALRTHANDRGVRLFGDMPIFVAHDSAEVWARPKDFDLNPDGTTRVVAGVPPDYFSETGQRWGNPLYRWDQLQENGFRFWIDRIRTQLKLFDIIRIDHFRGFEAYWEIPASEEFAINGRWIPAAGDALFEALAAEFGALPLVAEDLGVITDEVTALRKKFDMPGMKILQFAFDGGADNPYLPHFHETDSVVYTGTHDNDTSLGWFRSIDDAGRWHLADYLGYPAAQTAGDPVGEPMPWPLIRSALASVANLAILPMQDVLELDGASRMNRPGTTKGNWAWRFDWAEVDAGLADRLRHLVKLYGRRPGLD
ncbi:MULTISPECIES: 4-alpha-glucanotransferase [Thiorhodovibrio]|uniref:4-alpha-glucanotransferase n=1 Tax=Thiorhodovibrio TaxID=61593 RepID=UPI001913C7C2|nr:MULTISPECIES: 4-alpha-glucanotransferase [Thiorhodovibrio]MBK5969932.1 4-alpha-glucanotransferase [Thiorhodovibrio winogradskyi]